MQSAASRPASVSSLPSRRSSCCTPAVVGCVRSCVMGRNTQVTVHRAATGAPARDGGAAPPPGRTRGRARACPRRSRASGPRTPAARRGGPRPRPRDARDRRTIARSAVRVRSHCRRRAGRSRTPRCRWSAATSSSTSVAPYGNSQRRVAVLVRGSNPNAYATSIAPGSTGIASVIVPCAIWGSRHPPTNSTGSVPRGSGDTSGSGNTRGSSSVTTTARSVAFCRR